MAESCAEGMHTPPLTMDHLAQVFYLREVPGSVCEWESPQQTRDILPMLG